MKRMLVISALSLGLLTACSSESEKGTHQHEDGRVHADHPDSTQAAVSPADTTGHGHSHDRAGGHGDEADTAAHGHSHDRP